MTEVQAAILGVLQGAGEFLPISSSAHLALAPKLFGWTYQGLAYDVMLHLGTLLAVIIYFRRDWLEIFRDALARPKTPEGRMLWLLALASVPAGVAGLALNDLAETLFRDPVWIGCNLVFFSFVIYLADRRPAQTLDEGAFCWRHAVLIGLAQCIALMPGASRSGMTIMAALFLGYRRAAAARLSFLLSTPVILGAGLLEARKITPDQLTPAFAWGLAAAFLSGLAFIWLLMSWMKKRNLTPFLIYRVALGSAILWMFWGSK
ncbi:MAG TPA: UDP-diphosphatase [Elusimicrobia bacterium]|nr:UDP-diphosphatase [Elusimicrobiota bacterium]